MDKKAKIVLEKIAFHTSWIVLGILLSLLYVNFVSAEQSNLGTMKQHDCISLYQTCDDCTYVNLTSVKYPDGTIETFNLYMTKKNQNFNFTFCNTTNIGEYTYTVAGDKGGVYSTEVIGFSVSPSGFVGTLGFYILILVLSAGVIILGFSKDDAPLVILGSLGLYFVGIYTLFYGLDGMKDPVYTWGFGLIVLGIAFYLSVRSAWELIVD